jgi:hypothetical protein
MAVMISRRRIEGISKVCRILQSGCKKIVANILQSRPALQDRGDYLLALRTIPDTKDNAGHDGRR